MTVVVSVDPGKSGAVARLTLETVTLDLWRDFNHPDDLVAAIKEASDGASHGLIEKVNAMPGDGNRKMGVTSAFTFGEWAGMAYGALRAFLPVVHQPRPQMWQNGLKERFPAFVGKGIDSRALAAQIFPSYAEFFRRKMDHNSGDAVLIAVWWATTALNWNCESYRAN